VNGDFIRALTTAAYMPALKGSNLSFFCSLLNVEAAFMVYGPS